MSLAGFVQVGDVVIDATGKAWTAVISGSFPRLDAVPADGVGDTIPVDLLTEPVVVIARGGTPTELYSDQQTQGAGLSAAPVDQAVAPSDAPAPVEQA